MKVMDECRLREQRLFQEQICAFFQKAMTGKTLGEIIELIKVNHPWPVETNGLTRRVYEDKRKASEVRVIKWALDGLSVRVWLGEDLEPYRIVSKAWTEYIPNTPTGRVELLCSKTNE